MRQREYHYAKNVAKLEVARALVKRTFCLLEREEREQEAALRAIEKLIRLFEGDLPLGYWGVDDPSIRCIAICVCGTIGCGNAECRVVRPEATRSQSSEVFLVGLGRNNPEAPPKA